MKNNNSLVRKYILVFLCCLPLVGCTTMYKTTSATRDDILTMKATEEGRTQITVLIKHAFSIVQFEKIVEETFPDIDLVVVGNYTTAFSPSEYEARLKNDDLTDIIMTWPLTFGEEYLDDRLLDLSSLSFTTQYNLSMLDSIAKDGKLYYLPGPAQIRGIVYNKTLFDEKDWEVPKTYDEFLALCKTIEATGMRSILLGFANEEVLDTAFIGYSYGNTFATPKDSQWIKDYSQGTTKFIDHFDKALSTFQEMIDQGIWKPEDLSIDYSMREKLVFSRQAAMIEDSVLIARTAGQIANTTDEYALLPFFTPGGEGNDWVRLYMVCYIGLNKHLIEPQNSDKYEKVLKLMEFISTPEGQEALAADTGAMYSSVKGTKAPNVSETQAIVDTLNHGRYAIFPEIPKVQNTLREGLAKMITGEMTKEEVATLIDQANIATEKEEENFPVLGTATESFTLIETGNYITDAMKTYASSSMKVDIALFLDGGKDGRYNNKGVTAKLYQGEITSKDITRIMPDFKYGEKGECWIISMTGENLLNTLEYSIPVDNNQTGWFYYFSGLHVEFNPVAEPGSRIKSIKTSDGKEIETNHIYTIAISENSVPEDYILSKDELGITIGDIFTQKIQADGTISPSKDGRFILVD